MRPIALPHEQPREDPSTAQDRATSAIVNCQLNSEPKHEMTIIATTTFPTVWLNMWAKTRPNGAVELAS